MQIRCKNRLNAYIVVMLLAFEVMLSFSLFGYISIGTLTLSFVPVCVYIMGFLFGTKLCMLSGLVFGLTSMWMASVGAGSNLDYLYSPVLSNKPIASIILAIGTRVFLGFIAGGLLKYARKCTKHRYFKLVLALVVIQSLYTVVSLIIGDLLFNPPKTDELFVPNLIVNWFMECAVFSVVVICLCKVTEMKSTKTLVDKIQKGMNKTSIVQNSIAIICIGLLFLIFNVGIVTQHWNMSNRTFQILKTHINEKVSNVLFNLELQQMFSNLALYVIIIVILMFIYFYIIEHRDALVYRADRDMMTGLYNRETAKEKIMSYRAIHQGVPCTYIIVDIDTLKMINDTFGHSAGDETIIGIANALKATFRQTDIIARIGGDEFTVFLGGIASEELLLPIIDRLKRSIAEVTIANCPQKPHVSIGIKLDKTGESDIDELYRNADQALYYAKSHGKNTVAFYNNI